MPPPHEPRTSDRRRFFISAAEPSGDRHAAELIRAIRRAAPDTSFVGVAGPQMQAAGCELLDDFTQRSAMLLGALGLVADAWRLLGRVDSLLESQQIDAAVVVDSPTLHLPMAKRIRNFGVPVLYYIAPQLWAWAPWRIRRVRRRVDRLAVILPFEEGYFRQRGADAVFVGHPLIEQLQAAVPDQAAVRDLRGRGSPVIACLPGSRKHVIEEVLPGQIEVARRLTERFPEAAFLFAAASQAARDRISAALRSERLRAEVLVNANTDILAAADLALCASGTATLEVACLGVPMVVMYNGSKWGYRLVGRFLIRTPHLSLPNILAGRRIVPEFMPYYSSTEPIFNEALSLLTDQDRRSRVQRDLAQMTASLGGPGASDRAAAMAIELAHRSPQGA